MSTNKTPIDSIDLDDVLGQFFKRDLPAVWPACPTPPVPQRVSAPRIVSMWSKRSMPRLALAASVALMLLGYTTLSRHFTQDTTGNFNGNGPVISMKLNSITEDVTLPNGTPGRLHRNEIPGGNGQPAGIDFLIEELPARPATGPR